SLIPHPSSPFSRLLLWSLCLIFLAPLFWMVSTAIKDPSELMSVPQRFWPRHPTLVNFVKAVQSIPFFLYLKNTVVIALVSSFGVVLSCTPVAYALAHINFPKKRLLETLIWFTMFLPFPVVMVPSFLVFAKLKWINTFLPLTVPLFLGGSAYSILMLKQFFRKIPQELIDAARMEGASEWKILWSLVVPLSKNSLAVIFLLHFLYSWNDFLAPLIYLQDSSHYTLALGIQMYRLNSYYVDWSLLMAASCILVLPSALIFFFVQRTFVQQNLLAGIKG
ncbi:MAG: carbohydrate ABC transporter permease, partial [Elusimicrobia bacterium]|nr:carbohydrate ABC transporter permease [Elusimicrobiota bacterium]